MGWFIAILVLVYLIGVRVVARRFFRLRHGTSAESGEQGVLAAGLVGAVWPVSIFLPAVRDPGPCSHHRHVLNRARVVHEIQQEAKLDLKTREL